MSAARRLEGLGVVITRPGQAAAALAAALAAEGARAIVFPTLEIRPVPSTPAREAALDLLPACPLAIFVSANAVEHGLAAARARGPWPAATRVAGIGEATAERLRNSGFPEVISPAERFDSESLLALPELQAVEGRNIIVFRGEGGRERLKEALEARGARVTYAECYRRERPRSDPREVAAALEKGEVQAVSALSAESLVNFVALLDEAARARLSGVALAVPHAAIGDHPEARRFGRLLVTAPGSRGLADALATLRQTP